METWIHILEAVRFIALVLLICAVVIGIAFVWSQVKAEIRETMKMSRSERRKRKADDDDFFTQLVERQRLWLHTEKPLW